ncbi:ion transporter [Pseudonocardia xinjiangensis]|uniref:ion transporter n=1 Tax=Pseudonocardia xinjiangensis TaxID=75289 RepID=UPI0028ADDDB8|nr:ion transporter [Pseudonocardia xinjiangensis]
MIKSVRDTARRVVEHRAFQPTVIAVILLNAATLGLETSSAIVTYLGGLLHVVDRVALVFFVADIGLRLVAYGRRFWRDPWNIFDFLIVAIALLPASGPFSVLRALRILRVLRLISMVPSMRRVVGGLLAALPGMASISALLSLILYVAAVMGTKLFGAVAPESFGTLGTTLFTLFQTMTGEGWPDIAQRVMTEVPLAWIFFVVYILVSSFTVLNLFIAVVVSAMESQVMAEARAEEAEHAADEQTANWMILEEIKVLRAELAEMRLERAEP